MAKFLQIVLVAALAAVCCAEPARLRNLRQSRFSARQEVAEDVPAQTPYPPSGIVPEIRFDLPSEESALQPENTYLPPDNLVGVPAETYGPPEVASDDDVIVDEEPAVEADVEQPEVQSEEEPQDQEVVTEQPENNEIVNPQSGRLVLRRSSKLQVRPLRAQRLVVQPRPQRLTAAQPIYFANSRVFAYNPQFLRA